MERSITKVIFPSRMLSGEKKQDGGQNCEELEEGVRGEKWEGTKETKKEGSG